MLREFKMTHTRKEEKKVLEEKEYRGPDYLSDLPDDILSCSLFNTLNLSARAQLSKTTRQFRNFPEYQNANLELQSNLRQLLWLVARGKKRQAEALISQYPELLFCSGQTTDYSYYYRDGKRIQGKRKGTALQIALADKDFNLYDNNGNLLGEGMVEMLQRHFKKLFNGEAEMARQILEQFPPGWEEQEEIDHIKHLEALRKVRTAIAAASNDEEYSAAILEFQNALAPQEGLKKGTQWDAKLLQAAFEMGYEEYYGTHPKDLLFYTKIIGYLQTLAPANFAMAQVQGLKNLLEDGESFKRNLKFLIRAEHYPEQYYPFSSVVNFRIGFDAWVNCYRGRYMLYVGGMHAPSINKSSRALLKLICDKDNSLATIYAAARRSQEPELSPTSHVKL